jgi:hypothetical protein
MMSFRTRYGSDLSRQVLTRDPSGDGVLASGGSQWGRRARWVEADAPILPNVLDPYAHEAFLYFGIRKRILIDGADDELLQ